MAIYFNKNGETKEIATYESCISNITVSDPSSWGNTYSANNGSLKLTVQANPTASVRNETVTIAYKAGATNCSKTVDISQVAGDAPIVFQFSDGTTTKNPSLEYTSTAITYSVTSTSGGAAVNYTISNSCSWISVSKTSTGIRMSVDANTGSLRQCTFYLIQDGTSNRLTISVSQAASEIPTFTYCDGTSSKSLASNKEGGKFRYCITSKIGEAAGQPFEVVGQVCSWITIESGTTYFNAYIDENTDTTDRTCTVTLKQVGSTETISLAVTQESDTCNNFLDSCCGVGSYSHPEYDMNVKYNVGYQNADTVLYGSVCHPVASTVPSWLSVYQQNNIVYYEVLEENTGGYREAWVDFVLDSTTGTNVCQTASVLVRQDANPSLLMTCNLNIVNQTSEQVRVASIRFTFANGYITHERISEDVPAGGTWQDTATFLKSLNGQSLYVGHPIDVILGDGTVKQGTINNLTIQNGGTYTITFS